MGLSSIIRAIISPTPQKTNFKPDTLKPGSRLKGIVLGDQKGGKILVDFGNFRVFADIQFPTEAGQVLHVKVIESGQQLTLKLIDSASQPAENQKNIDDSREPITPQSLRKYASTLLRILRQNESLPSGEKLPQHIRRAMAALNNHMAPFDPESDTAKLAGHLKSQVQMAGFFYEKLLEQLIFNAGGENRTNKSDPGARIQSFARSDIKPNLQLLRAYLSRSGGALEYFAEKDIETLKIAVETLLADIVDQQHKTIIGPAEPDQTQWFTYFLHIRDSNKLSKLRIYYAPKKKNDSEAAVRISLLLDMDKIGAIRSDITFFNQALQVNFFVLNDKIKHLIEENLNEIQRPLAAIFKDLILTVSVSRAKIADFTQTEVNRTTNRKIDLRI